VETDFFNYSLAAIVCITVGVAWRRWELLLNGLMFAAMANNMVPNEE
jgi:hypothetical protein